MAASGRFNGDWVGLSKVGDPNSSFDGDRWDYTSGATGTMTFTAPAEPGQCKFRYLLDDGLADAARREPVMVSASGDLRLKGRSRNP